MTERVFITGLGVVSSIGTGKDAFFAALEAGKTGIAPIQSFDAERIGRKFGGEVKDFRASDHLARHEVRTLGRCSQMALAAARMAARDAGLAERDLAGPRVSVVLGTTMGDADVLEVLDKAFITQGPEAIRPPAIPRYGAGLLPVHVARAFRAEGMTMTLPAACAAGNYSIGLAADLIRAGKADAVVAGASELLQQLQFAGFVKLQAMAPEKCQPFDKNRHGILLGEGAGILVLESESRARARGAKILAEVGGSGITCDGHHVTRPHPDAWGSITAMRQAITNSGISVTDVDFVNAHGTGTKANDLAETKVMREVFGERRVPISSMKSMLGHCMGAASALEAIGCVFTLETGIYPPTINFETPDPECDVELVANVARKGKADVVLNNSLAFGGYNSVVCFARTGVLPEPRGGDS